MKVDLEFLEEFRSKDPNPAFDRMFPKGPGRGLFVFKFNGMHLRVTSNIGKQNDGSLETDHICVSVRSDDNGFSERIANDDEIEFLKKLFWEENEQEQLFLYDPPIKPFGNNNTIHIQKRKNNWEEIKS